MLEELVAISTPEQIEVYDKIIREKKEFAFYSGVVSQFGLDAGAASSGIDKSEFASTFKKSSLAWLLALARIEVGATMAMYGNSKRPFSDVAPQNEFGMTEYWAILMDDLVVHIQALETDDGLRKASRLSGKADSVTLAYLRRLKLISDMLKTVQAGGSEEYAIRAKEMDKALGKYVTKLVMKVVASTTNLEQSRDLTSERNSSYRSTKVLGSEKSCEKLAERLVEKR